MRYLYCKKCNEFYIGKHIDEICPKIFCLTPLVEIDDNMVVPIKILNSKGYKTAYCCSGHIERNIFGGYIAFKAGTPIPDTAPKGWSWDNHVMEDGKHCIRWHFNKGMSSIEKTKMIFKKTEELIKWCENLESIEED